MTCVFGNSVWCRVRSAFKYFSTACWAWKTTMSRNSGSAESRTVVLKSRSAFLIHSATSRRISSSGGLIENPAVFVRRIGDPADDVLGGLEPFRGDDDHVHRILDVPDGICDPEPLFMPVLGVGATMSRSMSLSFVISPVAAEPNRIILSGRATLNTRRTISLSKLSLTPTRFIIVCRRPAWKLAGPGGVHACIQFVSLLCFVESQ